MIVALPDHFVVTVPSPYHVPLSIPFTHAANSITCCEQIRTIQSCEGSFCSLTPSE